MFCLFRPSNWVRLFTTKSHHQLYPLPFTTFSATISVGVHTLNLRKTFFRLNVFVVLTFDLLTPLFSLITFLLHVLEYILLIIILWHSMCAGVCSIYLYTSLHVARYPRRPSNSSISLLLPLTPPLFLYELNLCSYCKMIFIISSKGFNWMIMPNENSYWPILYW